MSEDQPTKAHDHELWVSVARAAADRMIERHNQMIATYGLTNDSVQYYWSTDDATIVWSRAGEEFLRGRITSIGSVNAEKQTWLWSWANRSVPPAALGNIADVRRYGMEQNFPLLVWPGFQSDQEPVYQATMVALDILGADGLWRDYVDGLEMVFAVHDLQPS